MKKPTTYANQITAKPIPTIDTQKLRDILNNWSPERKIEVCVPMRGQRFQRTVDGDFNVLTLTEDVARQLFIDLGKALHK